MSERAIEKMGAAVSMADLGLRLPLTTLYAGLEFQQRFRLVRCE